MRSLNPSVAAAFAQTVTALAQLVKIFLPVVVPAGPGVDPGIGNSFLWSGDIFKTSWIKTGLSSGARNQLGPDGSANSACVVTTVDAVNCYLSQSYTVALNTQHTRAALIKAGTTSVLIFETTDAAVQTSTIFNVATQAITGSRTSGASIVDCGNGWFLCLLTWTSGASGAQRGDVVYINTYGASVGATTMTIGGFQIHTGAVFQGYVETTTQGVYGRYILLNSSNRLISWAGLNFAGANGLGVVSEIEDSHGELKGLNFSMSGAASASVALALDGADEWQGSVVEIYTAVLGTNHEVLDAMLEWSGFGDTLAIEDGADSCVIGATAESIAVDLLRGSVSTYSEADQQILFAGDRAFEHVTSQVGKPVVWPSKEWFYK